MSDRKPRLWIVAGVNGAGKTTLAKQLLHALPFINADEVAAQMAPGRPEQAAVAAGRTVLRQLEATFAAGKSAAWETTLRDIFTNV